jgi:hypothetical protein
MMLIFKSVFPFGIRENYHCVSFPYNIGQCTCCDKVLSNYDIVYMLLASGDHDIEPCDHDHGSADCILKIMVLCRK